jgi:long-chain acyl-CoA synthetase
MLYERWRQVAQDTRNELALREIATGRAWTFGELARLAEGPLAPEQKVVYPQGHSAAFVLAVLQAWRWGAVVCPLEPDQAPPRVSLPPAPCCHLKLTSATTGEPRLIAFTAAQLMADADNIVTAMGLRPDWPNLGAISLAHSYGFSNLVLPLLLHGVPLILAPAPLPEMVRRAGEGLAALTLAGVPALWRAWHEARAIPTNVRLALSAGAPLPVKLEQAVYHAGGLKIHNFYGSSECGGIAYDTTETPRQADECVGQPMPNVSLRVSEAGPLEVRSPAVGDTYWPTPDKALGGGVFRTNDLAELRDGSVFLRGRAGEQINIAGRKVSPGVIERALREHPAVVECLVFGVPAEDLDRGELIVACLQATGRHQAGEFKAWLLDKIPAWQMPREWWFVDSLASNQRGKLPRAEWRRKFLEGRAGRLS